MTIILVFVDSYITFISKPYFSYIKKQRIICVLNHISIYDLLGIGGFNMISDNTEKGKVESIYLPYRAT